MALDRQTKESLVEEYAGGFVKSPNAFVLGYKGITVPQADDLRSRIRAVGGRYQVVKNSLALLAMKDTEIESLSSHFDGPTAVAFCDEDVVSLAKTLADFSKGIPALEFRGGLVDRSPVAAEDIKTIAELPSREELVAKLVVLLASPVSRLVRALGGITGQFVSLVDQIRRQKESESS